MSGFISRGFGGRRRVSDDVAERVPPGQYVETGFPVLTAGPTPRLDTADWSLSVDGAVAAPRAWTWEQFGALPSEDVPCDIHCVTKWSKLGTTFRGVPVDALIENAHGTHVMAHAFGGYATNMPLADLLGGKAWVVTEHEGRPLPPGHGGPARLLVPHLYFWKSAKWLSRLEVLEKDAPGFWEQNGYHPYGDPWKEQRYWGD